MRRLGWQKSKTVSSYLQPMLETVGPRRGQFGLRSGWRLRLVRVQAEQSCFPLHGGLATTTSLCETWLESYRE